MLSLNTQRLISPKPSDLVSSIDFSSNRFPYPFPAKLGETYSENKCPRCESFGSLPTLKTPMKSSFSSARKVFRSRFVDNALLQSSVAASKSIESRAFWLRTSEYEICQHCKNKSAISGTSESAAGLNSMPSRLLHFRSNDA